MSMRREIITRQCVKCAAQYVPTNATRTTCGGPVCVTLRLAEAKRCRDEAARARRLARATEARKAVQPRICVTCGAEFLPAKSINVACSPGCRLERKRQVNRDTERVRGASRITADTTRRGQPRKQSSPVLERRMTAGIVACAECKHGLESSASSIGYECALWVGRKCGPLAGAPVFFEERA